jgi:hypothetical protein
MVIGLGFFGSLLDALTRSLDVLAGTFHRVACGNSDCDSRHDRKTCNFLQHRSLLC